MARCRPDVDPTQHVYNKHSVGDKSATPGSVKQRLASDASRSVELHEQLAASLARDRLADEVNVRPANAGFKE